MRRYECKKVMRYKKSPFSLPNIKKLKDLIIIMLLLIRNLFEFGSCQFLCFEVIGLITLEIAKDDQYVLHGFSHLLSHGNLAYG